MLHGSSTSCFLGEPIPEESPVEKQFTILRTTGEGDGEGSGDARDWISLEHG